MRLRRSGAALLAALTLGGVGVAHGTPQSLRPASASVPAGALFVPMSPTRVLDTRDGTGTGGAIAPLGPSGFLLAGRQPAAVGVEPGVGQTVANLATVALGAGGQLDVGNFRGNVDVIVDLAGYFAPPATPCAVDCVITWGDNEFGRVGNGTTGGNVPSPAQVPGLSGVSAIASGFANTYALDQNGTVFGWGRNELQGLGNGHADGNLPVPVPVVGLPTITEIAAGTDNGYAVDTAHHVWAWGYNGQGGLGNGTASVTAVPVQVLLSGQVTTVVGAGTAAYALLADGTLWTWGQLGFGPATQVPTQVAGLATVTKVATGWYHMAALATTP